MFEWMAWTTPVAVFFTCIVLMLIGMTVWEIRSPTVERKGFLPMATTRGDRLFISLIAAAVIHLLWIGFAGTDTIATLPIGEGVEVSSLWLASIVSLGVAVVIFRNV